MRLRLQELQELDSQAQKVRVKGLQKSWEDGEGVPYYQDLSFVSETIRIKLINQYHNDSLAGYFGIKRTWEFITRKYY